MEVQTETTLPRGAAQDAPHRDRAPFLRIYLLAITFRLVIAIFFPTTDPGSGDTFACYAVRIATGGGFGPSALVPPGYPYLLATLFRLHGSAWATILLSQAVIGALVTLPVLLLAEALKLRRGPMYVAGLLTALLPAAAAETGRISSVPLTALLVLVAAWLFLRTLPSPRPLSAVLSGLFLGAAVLTRGGAFLPALILSLTPPGAAIVIGGGERRTETWIRRALVPAVMILVVTPWCLRNSRIHERPVLVDTTWGFRLRAATIPSVEPWTLPTMPRDGSQPDNLLLSDNDLAAFRSLGYFVAHPGAVALTWVGRLEDFLAATDSPIDRVSGRELERRLLYRVGQALVWGSLLTLLAAWAVLRGLPGSRERSLFWTAMAFVLVGVLSGAIRDARLLCTPLLAIPAAQGIPGLDATSVSPLRRRLFQLAIVLLWTAILVGVLRG